MNLADFLFSKALEYEENRRMYTIFDTVNDGIILTDHNGNIVLKNIKADELYNITFNGYPVELTLELNVQGPIRRLSLYENGD